MFVNNLNRRTKAQVEPHVLLFAKDFLPEQQPEQNDETPGKPANPSRTGHLETLREVRRLDAEIAFKLRELRRLEELADGLTPPPPGERIQSSKVAKPVEESVARILDLRDELARDALRLLRLKRDAMEVVGSVRCPNTAEVLWRRYFDGQTWEAIAEKMGVSRQWVTELHRRACLKFTSMEI